MTDARPASLFSRDFWLGEVDARPLALFRIGLAAVILFDAASRLSDFRAFYTDEGILPRAEMIARAGRWSLFDLVGTPMAVGALYALGVCGVVALLVGWRTRVASVTTFFFLHALIERNLAVCDSGDNVLRVMAFWLAFADSGALYSLDARRTAPRATVPAFPVRLLQLQVALIYLFGAVAKRGPDWRHGTAVERALLGSDFARSTGRVITDHPALGVFLTHATLAIELFLPFAVFARPAWPRRVALLAGLALHLGIFLTMRVGIFSIAMPITYLVLLRAEDLPELLPRPGARPLASFSHPLVFLLATLMTLVLVQQVARSRNRTIAPLSATLEALGLWQNWSLFAPEPPHWNLRWEARSPIGDVLPAELAPDSHFGYRRWLAYRFKLDGPEGRRYLVPLGHWICRARADAQTQRIDFIVHALPIRVSGEPRDGDHEEEATIATVPCPVQAL